MNLILIFLSALIVSLNATLVKYGKDNKNEMGKKGLIIYFFKWFTESFVSNETFILKVSTGSHRCYRWVDVFKDLCRNLNITYYWQQTSYTQRHFLGVQAFRENRDFFPPSGFSSQEPACLTGTGWFTFVTFSQRVCVDGGSSVSRPAPMLSPGRTASSRLLRPTAWLSLRVGCERTATSSLQKGKSRAKRTGPFIISLQLAIIPQKWRSSDGRQNFTIPTKIFILVLK